MGKRSKSNKKKIILIVIILVILISLMILIVSNRKEKPIAQANPLVNEIDTKTDNILNLSGFGTFFDKYTGELKSSEIAKGLKEITINKIPRIYGMIEKYNKSELEKFFNNNSSSIRNMVGIDNQEDFVKFAQGLQNAKVDFNKWDRLDIVTDTFVDESDKDGYAYAEYEVTYINDTVLRFSVYVSKSSTDDVLYIVNVV